MKGLVTFSCEFHFHTQKGTDCTLILDKSLLHMIIILQEQAKKGRVRSFITGQTFLAYRASVHVSLTSNSSLSSKARELKFCLLVFHINGKKVIDQDF